MWRSSNAAGVAPRAARPQGTTAKGGAAQRIGDVSREPVDAGPLRNTRDLEPFALAIAHAAYESGGSPESPIASSGP